MKNLFTLTVGFLLFGLVYFHVKRQNTYLSTQPTPDVKTAMQASPVKTLTIATENPLVFRLVSGQ